MSVLPQIGGAGEATNKFNSSEGVVIVANVMTEREYVFKFDKVFPYEIILWSFLAGDFYTTDIC